MAAYRCYSCGKVCDFGDLYAECMCFNDDDKEASYRGVCKGCEKVPYNQWVKKLGPEHHLKKLPQYTVEQKKVLDEYWADVEAHVPGTFSISIGKDNKCTFTTYEYNDNYEVISCQSYTTTAPPRFDTD